MTSLTTRLIVVALFIAGLSACGSSSGSASSGTQVDINAAPLPASMVMQDAGAKTFVNDLGDTVTLNKAYLVLSSATIESDCGVTFTAFAEQLISILISNANAHTTTTPTSTGEPYVINLLGTDNSATGIGRLSPPENDYCGVRLDMLAADEDTANLPTGTGEPEMIGKSIYIEGSYTLAVGGSGAIHLSSGAALSNRDLLLSALLLISDNNKDGKIGIGVNYDTWFNMVDLALLESATVTFASPVDPNVSRVLQNIVESIHQT